MKKKLISTLLILAIITSIFPVIGVSAKSKKQKSISLNFRYKDLLVGEKCKIKVKNAPKGAKITYTVDTTPYVIMKRDENYIKKMTQKLPEMFVKVSSDGKVTAKKEGQTHIIVNIDGINRHCFINVFNKGDAFYEMRQNSMGLMSGRGLMAYEEMPDSGDGSCTWYMGVLLDKETTKQNLLKTGLFEECEVSEIDWKWYEKIQHSDNNGLWNYGQDKYPLGIKPKKPVEVNGTVLYGLAEYKGYYIGYDGEVFNVLEDRSYGKKKLKDKRIFLAYNDEVYYNEKIAFNYPSLMTLYNNMLIPESEWVYANDESKEFNEKYKFY